MAIKQSFWKLQTKCWHGHPHRRWKPWWCKSMLSSKRVQIQWLTRTGNGVQLLSTERRAPILSWSWLGDWLHCCGNDGGHPLDPWLSHHQQETRQAHARWRRDSIVARGAFGAGRQSCDLALHVLSVRALVLGIEGMALL